MTEELTPEQFASCYYSAIIIIVNIIIMPVILYPIEIMASGPITSWEIDGETVETVSDFNFWGSKNHCRWWQQP